VYDLREIDEIKRELDVVKFETEIIKNDVERIKDKLIDHTPDHFSKQDWVRAFIGALFFGFSVLFSLGTINIAVNIPEPHLYIIVACTLILLTLEIYIIGYSKVADKKNRKFGQFWIKRIIMFYFIALLVASSIAYIFGLQYIIAPQYFVSLVIILSAPCAIGASLGDLLKKY
jgi:uncharacterized membrane protein